MYTVYTTVHILFTTCFAADGNLTAMKGAKKTKQKLLHSNNLPNVPLTGWALSVCFAS